jgi:hypothetical protein
MIKQGLILTATSFIACGALAAADLRDNVGVGLGTMIFEGHNALLSQISAATTNGSSGNQTFAITSGTSDAKPYDGFVKNEQINNFVKDNMDVLAREMAAGAGESVDTLAELMAVPADQRGTFAKALQSNFGEIFSSAAVTHTEVIEHAAKFVPAA